MMTKKIILITGSALIGLISMLAVIFTLIGTGSIDVEQKTLVFASDSAETVYSGDALTASGWQITSGELKEGHVAKVVVSGSQTTVGSSLNSLSATIVDSKGADVTDHYQIEYQPGTLKVFHRSLQIMANDAVKTYDGTALTCNQYTIISGSLPAGQRIEPTFTGTITDVGSMPNSVTVIVKDNTGADVTSNYNVNTVNGTLTVAKRTVHFQSESVEKIYDGAALTSQGANIIDGTLVSGHTMSVDATNSITNVGSIENIFSVRVYDSMGKEVSSNYDLSYHPGSLTVIPAQVTITTASDVKPYDGTPLKNGSWQITTGAIVDGETINVIMDSEITQLGNVENKPVISVLNSSGEETAGNYDFTVIAGKLTITASAFNLVSSDDSKDYDGTPLERHEVRLAGYPLPENHTIECDFTGSITTVGKTNNTFTAIIRDGDGNDVTASFNINYVYGTLTVTKRPLEIVTDNLSKAYDGAELLNNGSWYYSQETSLADGDIITVTFTGSQLYVGSSKNSVSVIIKNSDGNDVTSNYDIKGNRIGTLFVYKRSLSLYSNSAEDYYNGKPLTKPGVYYSSNMESVLDLNPINDHTVIFTMTGEQILVGKSENKFTVIIKNSWGEDVTSNFDIETIFGTLKVNKMALRFESATDEQMYNGSAFTNTNVYLKSGTIADDQYSIADVTGTITNVGTVENTFSIAIKDAYGRDYTENYDITLDAGTLTVTQRDDGSNNYIYFKSPNRRKTYDGYALQSTVDDLTTNVYNYGVLAPGHRLDTEYINNSFASQTNVGSSSNTFEIIIRDENNFNVTANYKIKLTSGSLNVDLRTVEFYSDPLSFEYDGDDHYGTENSVHLKNEYSYPAPLADGQSYEIEMTADVNADYCNVVAFDKRPENSFNVKILSGNQDVSSNYTIRKSTGKITVHPRKAGTDSIYFESPSNSKIYDGFALSTSDWEISTNVYSYILYNHSVEITPTASITNVGEQENTFTVSITDSYGNDVISNYDIEPLRFGTLKVSKRPIKYTTNSAERIYNAQPLTNESGYFTIDGYYLEIPSYQTYSIDFTSRITDVGSTPNECGIMIFDGNDDVTSNYEITYETSELVVFKADVTFESDDYNRNYDGYALTYENAEISYSSFYDYYYYTYTLASDSQYYVCDFTGSITNAGTTPNAFTVNIYDTSSGKAVNVTSNYNVNYVYGLLTVNRPTVIFESYDAYKTYDGTPLNTYGDMPGCDIHGLTYDFNYTSSLTNAGNMKNEFTVTIYDQNGNAANDNYYILYSYGTLTVLKKTVTLKSGTVSKDYDGSELKGNPDTDYWISGGGLINNQYIAYDSNSSITNAGVAPHEFTATIFDTSTGEAEDVTENYSITYVYGNLIVNKVYITVESASDSKVYDAEPLTVEDINVIGDLRNPDAYADVTVTGSITDVGSVKNEFYAVIVANGVDISDNYIVTKNYGTLRIVPQPIYVRSNDKTAVYSGAAITPPSYPIDEMYEIYSGGLAVNANHQIIYTSSVSITNVGSVDNKFDVLIIDENGNDVNSNYSINKTFGKITVTPIYIKCENEYQSKIYDGTPLVGDKDLCKLTDGTLADNQTIDFVVTGSITDAGKIENTYYAVITDNLTGDIVTNNYVIEYFTNYLEVIPVTVNITTAAGEHIYNAEEYYLHEYTSDANEKLVLGHVVDESSVRFSSNSALTSVGSVKNTIVSDSIVIMDTNNGNANVTHNYRFNFTEGILKVLPRDITVTTPNGAFVYDGSEHKRHEYEIGDSQLLDSIHEIETVFASTTVLTNVGKAKNEIDTFVIRDKETGIDVTYNYNVRYEFGTVEVTKRPVKISSLGAYSIYDGQPHSCSEYVIDSLTPLVDGHSVGEISFSPNATITDVGKVENQILHVTIVADGTNVTDNYAVDLSDCGTITVDPRPITIRSGDKSKIHDSTPLTCSEWSIVSLTKPVDGHNVQVAVTGTRTEVGESENFIAEVIITYTDSDGTDINVTHNYAITKQHGSLVVKAASTQPGEDDSEEAANGGSLDTSGKTSGGGGGSSNELNFKLFSNQSGKIYLRLMSFGDYAYDDGEGEWLWSAAPEYNQILNINGEYYSYNYLTGLAIHNSGIESAAITVESFIYDQYYIPYFPDTFGGNYKIPTSDVVNAFDDFYTTYSLYYYLYSGYGSDLSLPTEYAALEEAYREFVYQNYLNVDSELKSYLNGIISANINVNSPTLISDVASYIQNAAKYNLDYDTAMDYEDNPMIAFLGEYKEGVCRHYASAATALYRTLGIPARYTIGYSASTKAGQWVEVRGAGHAWVEVYIDGVGWMPVEVTGSLSEYNPDFDDDNDDDGDNENKKAITISPKTVYYSHGSEEIPTEFYEISGITSLINEGYKCVATIKIKNGAQPTSPGIYELEIQDYKLYDSNDRDVTDKFKVTTKVGYLQIYLEELTVETTSASKTYDGTALTSDFISCEGHLQSGHMVQTLVCKGSQTTVGKSPNTFDIKIVDQNGKDVTSYYKINKKYGTLTVDPIKLTVTSEGADATYNTENPTPLTNSNYTIDSHGTDISGYEITVTITGSQTNPGSSTNKIAKVTVKNSQGIDITSSCDITLQEGELVVYPPEIQYN